MMSQCNSAPAVGSTDPAVGADELQSADSTVSRPPRSRVRTHLATYPILAKSYHLANDYSPFGWPSRLLDNAPGLPDPLDAAVDSGLTSIDNVVESRISSVKKSYERWVLRPQENIRTGVGVYTEWGKGTVAGGIRKVEEGVFSVGEYLLPADATDGHETSDSKSYWTSTESTVDSDEEDNKLAFDDNDDEGGDRSGFPTSTSRPGARLKRSASEPSLPPFHPGRPDRELYNLRKLVGTYAHRTYVRNVHKTPGRLLYDALDLAKTEAKKAVTGLEEKYAMEIGYFQKMMEVGR